MLTAFCLVLVMHLPLISKFYYYLAYIIYIYFFTSELPCFAGSSDSPPPYSIQRAYVLAYASKQPAFSASLERLEAYLAYRLYSFSQSQMEYRYSIKDSRGRHYLDVSYDMREVFWATLLVSAVMI